MALKYRDFEIGLSCIFHGLSEQVPDLLKPLCCLKVDRGNEATYFAAAKPATPLPIIATFVGLRFFIHSDGLLCSCLLEAFLMPGSLV